MKNTTRRRATTKSLAPVLNEAALTLPDMFKAAAQAPAVPISSAPVASSPAGTIVVWKRYSETTGGPQVAIRFEMGDPAANREYCFDVPTAEAVADQILEVCEQHRADFDPEWFTDQPILQKG